MIVLPIHLNIIKYVVSEYLNYDDIDHLKDIIKHIYLNPKRITKRKSTSFHYIKMRTYVDGVQIKTLTYNNDILTSENNYDLNFKMHGRQYHVTYDIDKSFVETFYKHGFRHGTSKCWYFNNILCYTQNWQNDELLYEHNYIDGTEMEFDSTGKLLYNHIYKK